MNRRKFLATGLAAGGTAAALALAGCSFVPVFPQRPSPDMEAALGWISHSGGRYTLLLPRAEIGQNIATALKQVACEELGADWQAVEVQLQRTTAMSRVRATVGSDSIRDYAEPLAQACAALRDHLAAGAPAGPVPAVTRPRAQLRAFRGRRHVGRSPEPEQIRAIVTGAPLYAADMHAPAVLYGRVLRAAVSPERPSAPRRWDLDTARLVPGFVAAHADPGFRLGASDGLGILAETPGALDRVEAALAVDWLVEDAPDGPATLAEAVDIDARLAAGDLAHTVRDEGVAPDGPWAVDLRLDIGAAPHGGIEPRAALAVPRADGGIEVWTGSQDVFFVRDVLARALDLPAEKVDIRGCRAGGAFGGRTICTVEAEAALLARAAGRPVKLQWSRAQELAFGFHRPPGSHRIQLRLEGGRLGDWRHRFASSHILFTNAAVPPWLQGITDTFLGDDGVARGALPPYRTGARDIAFGLTRLPVFTGPWRGLGAGPNGLVVESAIDAAAAAAGRDPLAFRLAHVEDPRLASVLRRAGEIAGWPGGPAPAAGRRTGRGLACGIYKGMSYAAVVADVAVDPDGRVQVARLWCVHDCGAIINPDQVRAQCEGNLAWGIGMVLTDELPVEDGAVAASGFVDAPIPLLTDMPAVTVHLLDSDRPPGGAGETAIAAAPGAIANAVRAATGIRPLRFPLRPADFALA